VLAGDNISWLSGPAVSYLLCVLDEPCHARSTWRARDTSSRQCHDGRMSQSRPTVFIGSSVERLPVAGALQGLLDYDCEVTVWSQGVFGLSHYSMDKLMEWVHASDFAILVVDADDTLESRGDNRMVARDNVVFEYGLFSGVLGRERAFLVHDRTRPLALPSDWLGLTTATYHPHVSGNLRSSLGAAAREILDAIARMGPRVRDGAISLFPRDEIQDRTGSVAARLEKAQIEVRISGNDCKRIVESESAHLESALKRGVNVRIMCADPECGALLEMLSSIDPRFEDPGEYIDSMHSVTKRLGRFKERYPGLFQAKFLPILPGIGFFTIDPTNGGSMKVEIYTPKPWGPVASRPHFTVPADSPWRDYFLRSWENYWALARDVVPSEDR
jgi:predicted nucleotide-binding protein